MPYGELITVLTADLSQLEKKLEQAEARLKQFNSTANQLGKVKLGVSGTGRSGASGGGGGGLSPEDREEERQRRAHLQMQRERLAEEQKLGRAHLEMGRERLKVESLHRRARGQMDREFLSEEGIHRQAQQEMEKEFLRRRNRQGRRWAQIGRENEAEERLHRIARVSMNQDSGRRANQAINEESRQRRAHFEMGRERLQVETLHRRAHGEMGRDFLGEETLQRTARVQMGADFAKRAANAMKAQERAIESLGHTINQHGTQKWRQLKSSVGDVIDKLKFFGSMAIGAGLAAWVKQGIELNAQYQRFAITLETVLDLSAKITDRKTGRVLTKPERDVAISQKAASLFKTVREVAAPLPLTASELFQVTSENLGFAMNAGAKLGTKQQDKKLVTVFAQIAQLAKNLGLPGGERQLSQEIRGLFEGEKLQSLSVAKQLGFTKSGEVKKLKEDGTLLDELLKRLSPAIERTSTNAQKFINVVSNLKSKWEDFTRGAFSKAFEHISQALSRLNEHLSDATIARNAEKIGEAISKIADAVISFMEGPWPGRLADWLKTIVDYRVPLLSFVGVVWGMKKAFDGFSAAVAGIESLDKLMKLIQIATGRGLATAGAGAAGDAVGMAAGTGGALGLRALLPKLGLGGAMALGSAAIPGVMAATPPALIAMAGGTLIGQQRSALVADEQRAQSENALARLRARNPVQRQLDRLERRRTALTERNMRLRGEGAFDSQGNVLDPEKVGIIQTSSEEVRRIRAKEDALRSRIPGTAAFDKRIEAEFRGRQDPNAAGRDARAREIAMLRALQQQFAPDETKQLHGDAARDILKYQKAFKIPEIRAQAIKARRNKLRTDESALNQDTQAARLDTGADFLDATGNKAQALTLRARSSALSDAAKVNRGEMKPEVARLRELTAFAQANKELVDGRRNAVKQARGIMDDFAKATEDNTKRQREYQNRLYEFERQTQQKRKSLLREQEEAQRHLNDAIRDQARAAQDVASSRAQRAVRKGFKNFAGQEIAHHQELFHDRSGHLVGGSNSTGSIQELLFQQEMRGLSINERNDPDKREEARLKVKRQINEWSGKLASPGGSEDVLKEIKDKGIDLTREQKSGVRRLGIKAEQTADQSEEQKDARDEEDETRKLNDAQRTKIEAKDQLSEAGKALKEFPSEVAKTITELRENFNSSVRDSAAGFRNLAEAARATVEDLKNMGGGKSPLAGQIKGIQSKAAATGNQRPKFFDERFGDVSGKVAESASLATAHGGVNIHVNFPMSSDTKKLGEEFGKKLERDARRYAPRR